MKTIQLRLVLLLALLFSALTMAEAKPEKKTVVFSVELHCENCKAKIERNLAYEKGVLDLKVLLKEKTVTLTYDIAKTDEKKLADALKKLGYEATPVVENEPVKIEKKMTTIKLNKADFLTKIIDYETAPNEWNYLGDKPAIIDFYADWCGPCKRIAPMLEELAEEYGDKIYIYKLDTEKEKEVARLFGIRSIPSLLFIPMTGKPQMTTGALPKNELKKAIDTILLKPE